MLKVSLKLSPDEFYSVVGSAEENLRELARLLNLSVGSRGNEIFLSGSQENEKKAERFLKTLESLVRSGHRLNRKDISMLLAQVDRIQSEENYADVIIKTFKGKKIFPKTLTQKAYVEAIRRNTVVFGIGPAGTGKTYLAVAMAVAAFKNGSVDRIILTRPAVEAGEKLGFLPGTLQEKIDPYLKPLYDALYEMMSPEKVNALLGKNIFEIAPLAYMRGRTLNDAFIILDEAQNTTKEQMKMFLTRLGFNSKVVVTGDITQIDLPKKERSGLLQAYKILRGIEGIEFVEFKKEDVVRHKLVQEIIGAYERAELD